MYTKFFCLVLFLFSAHLVNAYELNSAGADVWEAVEPFFLPENHPIKASLDQIFNSPEVTLNRATLRKAGFSNTKPGKYSKTIVASHPDLKGYLVKMYADDQLGIEDWYHWKHRIQGAESIREAIHFFGYENLFVVPKKWIYPLPSQLYPPEGTQRKQFVLIVEDMDIVSEKKNLSKWKSARLPTSTLDALYIILAGLGLWDSVYAFNLPFTKNGKIAFIDTEFHHRWPVHLSRLKQYLGSQNKEYWQALINQGGPAS